MLVTVRAGPAWWCWSRRRVCQHKEKENADPLLNNDATAALHFILCCAFWRTLCNYVALCMPGAILEMHEWSHSGGIQLHEHDFSTHVQRECCYLYSSIFIWEQLMTPLPKYIWTKILHYYLVCVCVCVLLRHTNPTFFSVPWVDTVSLFVFHIFHTKDRDAQMPPCFLVSMYTSFFYHSWMRMPNSAASFFLLHFI